MGVSDNRLPSFLETGVRLPLDAARVAILPVPYDGTASYGRGAALGPAAVLAASQQIEFFDERLGFEPKRCGIWTDAALELGGARPQQVVERVAERFGELLDAGKWVVMLGGEHSITPGGVEAASARHPGLHVVQLDAHADLREAYEGERFSHACAMARCLECAPVHAIGIRSYSSDEAERMRTGIPGYRVTHAWEMERPGWIEQALEGLEGRSVYLTVDVDYFDPSILPATGTPEPGGGRWWPTLQLLEALFERSRIVACDVVELAPIPGLHHADFTVARLIYKLIGYACNTTLSFRP